MASQVGRTEVDDAPTATRRPGRAREIPALVLWMTSENPTWGYTRLQGALRNVGHRVARATVARILKNAGVPPVPERSAVTQRVEFVTARHRARLTLLPSKTPDTDGCEPPQPSFSARGRHHLATSHLPNVRGSSDGTVLFACAALSIAARLPCSWILSSHLRSEDDGVDRPTEDSAAPVVPTKKRVSEDSLRFRHRGIAFHR